MTRQREHVERVRQAGGRRFCGLLSPEATAALAKLRERYPNDAAAVNAAVVELAEAVDRYYGVKL